MTLEEAKAELDKFVKLKTTMRPTFADVLMSDDVVEVRHGLWKNEIDTGAEMMACSVCGARVVKLPYISAVGRKGYAYCPYCGAKMEGEKNG